jgi:hypothetical protein
MPPGPFLGDKKSWPKCLERDQPSSTHAYGPPQKAANSPVASRRDLFSGSLLCAFEPSLLCFMV